MKNDISIYRDMKMLNDEKFILWCLNPTKELDRHWRTWVEEHPDQTAIMERTKETVLSIRLNEDKMPEDERRQLQVRILHDIRKNKNNI